MRYVLRKENVKLLGRTALIGENLWLDWSAAGAEFFFEGKELQITVLGGDAAEETETAQSFARLGIYVDDVRVTTELLRQKKKTIEIISGDVMRRVRIKILKLSEAPMSTLGIAPIETQGRIFPTPEGRYKAEFIGDSITCGYAVEDMELAHSFSTATEDVTKGYAYLTAERLGLDANIIACSGYGVLSGFTGDENVQNTTELLPPYYETLGFSRDVFEGDQRPQELLWDFSSFSPDIVVLNLGTNDSSYCKQDEKKQALFTERYLEFLKLIHEKNPQAKLLCVYGVMEDGLSHAVEQAVDAYKASVAEEIAYLKLVPDDGSRGYAVNYHPAAATHMLAAERVAEKVKMLLNLE